ncbi:MAG: oppD5 [Chlamydiia bacterium]|nr:oppD5 [Chlamydiia bacterium]
MANSTDLLHIDKLSIGTEKILVDEISFAIPKASTTALVGESGSGKSLTAQAILGLFLSPEITIKAGSIFYCGENLVGKSKQEMRKLRNREIGFIPQNPMNALNPTLTIGFQLTESSLLDHPKERALEMLQLVGIADPKARFHAYPHELSGGMRQRVLIAMSLINNPKLLIADEPTTALDSTIQAQIMELLKDLKEKLAMSILFITHDLGLVAQIADHVVVMRHGQIVEQASVTDIFYQPKHPYTKELLSTIVSA